MPLDLITSWVFYGCFHSVADIAAAGSINFTDHLPQEGPVFGGVIWNRRNQHLRFKRMMPSNGLICGPHGMRNHTNEKILLSDPPLISFAQGMTR